MIVITLAGEAKRFFDAGYTVVKYKLPYGDSTVIENIFNYLPKEKKILLVINKKFNDYSFFVEILKKLKFNKYFVVEIDGSNGQYESVELGLNNSRGFWTGQDPITIYNGDTIRRSYNWNYSECDGYIEVFIADGDHWSFVNKIGKVNEVVEKERISPYCSSGLYYFRTVDLFLRYKDLYYAKKFKEFYIAPYYNLLINNNLFIKSGLVEKNNFIFCGTPIEYEQALKEN